MGTPITVGQSMSIAWYTLNNTSFLVNKLVAKMPDQKILS